MVGRSFGLWSQNSINVSRRPSEMYLDKIDLFAHTNCNGFNREEYMGSVDIDKQYELSLTFNKRFNKYWIEVFEDMPRPIINFSSDYKYPFFNMGYTITKTYGDKILIERKNERDKN